MLGAMCRLALPYRSSKMARVRRARHVALGLGCGCCVLVLPCALFFVLRALCVATFVWGSDEQQECGRVVVRCPLPSGTRVRTWLRDVFSVCED